MPQNMSRSILPADVNGAGLGTLVVNLERDLSPKSLPKSPNNMSLDAKRFGGLGGRCPLSDSRFAKTTILGETPGVSGHRSQR